MLGEWTDYQKYPDSDASFKKGNYVVSDRMVLPFREIRVLFDRGSTLLYWVKFNLVIQQYCNNVTSELQIIDLSVKD